MIVELLLFFVDCRACELYDTPLIQNELYWDVRRYLRARGIIPEPFKVQFN